MSAHTKGTWIARQDPHGGTSDWCVGLDDDVTPVDYVAVCNKRDAHLIAAAPDLLAALQLLERNSTRADWPTDIYDAMQNAIAKATQP